MPAISRVTQKLFGSTAGINQVAQFGSKAAGAPLFTTDPATIQALSEFTAGWFDAVLGVNNPMIEDMNALWLLAFRQIAYILERGIPAWDSGTTYFTGDIVSSGTTGDTYVSLIDTNLNQAVTDATKWQRINNAISPPVAINASVGLYTLTVADSGKTFNVTTAAPNQLTFGLPTPVSGFVFTVKDVSGIIGNGYPISIQDGTVEGLASTFTCRANYGTWTFYCDGSQWWIR